MIRDQVVLTNGLDNFSNTQGEAVDYSDLHDSFKVNYQLSSAYEISLTLTYTDQFAEAYKLAKMKRYVEYAYDDGTRQFFAIQQMEEGIDENGQPTLQITATHALIDLMKNIRIDPKQPTEDNPDVSGSGSDSSSDSSDDNEDNQQPGTTVTVKQTDVQQTYSLEEQLHKFIDNNDQGVKLAIYGTFPKMANEATGSLYEWLGSNLASYGAFWYPDGYTLRVYDLPSIQHRSDETFRYLNNMTKVDLQSDGTELVNDCWVYGGKVQKDITTVTATGGVSNGVTTAVNGDWSQAAKNAANVMGVSMNDQQLGVLLAQIKLESGGNDKILGGTDGLNDGRATGLLQFKPVTFIYYFRPPYTNILSGFDQLIAFFNIPNCFGQITGHHGWSPSGAPLSKATIQAKPATDNSWGWPFPGTGEGSFSSDQLFGVQPGGGFRPNGFHDGLDFGSVDHPGSEVHAVHGGTVTQISWGSGGIGYYVVITDSSGLNCEYQEAFIERNNISVAVGQQIKTGDVIGVRTNNHLHLGITRAAIPGAFSKAFTNDGTWLDPLQIIKNGGAPSGGTGDSGDSGTTSSTTSETYYSLYYHYVDKDSQKRYGVHVGAPIVQDSIYDMDTLKAFVANTVKHEPDTTFTTTMDDWHTVALGYQIRVYAPEMNIKSWETLVGYSGNPFNETQAPELTYRNTGLELKSFVDALAQDLQKINRNNTLPERGVSIGTKQEDHFANPNNQKETGPIAPKYNQIQMNRLAQFMQGKDVTLDGR